MNIAFIGFGNMAQAIAKGLIKQKGYHLFASDPNFSEQNMCNEVQCNKDNQDIAKKADIIIIAVKPNQVKSVIKEIGSLISPECLIISVAAGVPLAWLNQQFTNKQPIIRCMPNIPAAVKQAATALISNEAVNEHYKKQTEFIFSNIGIISWLTNDADMDRLTALSGSGPAYVFKFMESMISAAEKLGLSKDIAQSFTFQTVKGALSIAERSNLSLPNLRKQVTSPQGTTAAALEILNSGEFDSLLLKAMEAARQRATELGTEINQS